MRAIAVGLMKSTGIGVHRARRAYPSGGRDEECFEHGAMAGLVLGLSQKLTRDKDARW
jgi:hypothetical protein